MTNSENTKFCWAIFDGAAGHRSQVCGLAEAIGTEFEIFEYRLRWCYRLLPSSLVPLKPSAFRSCSQFGHTPSPDFVISCGRQAALAALTLKKSRSDTFLIHLQDPQTSHSEFGMIVTPDHDSLDGPNVIKTVGALHHLTLEKLQIAAKQGPVAGLEKLTGQFATVLLGGPNKYYAFDENDIRNLISHLQTVSANSLHLAIIPSRRTPAKAVQQLQETFEKDHFVWNGEGENPYLSALALCSYCIVTSDSVSMISEATITGRPVFIEMLDEKRPAKKFRKFHENMIHRGFAQPFSGELKEWFYEPIHEATLVAGLVREKLRNR